MANREVALEFLSRFCQGDIESLAPLLTEDLRVSGPLFEGSSRREYLDRLRLDPPERSGFAVLSVTEAADNVSILYDYERLDRTLRVAQLFKFAAGRICELVLVFDTGAFE